MLVYRITRAKFANDLSGEGNRLYGSRWIPTGIPAVYTSQNRALAVLEFYTHLLAEFAPGKLKLVTIDIPSTIHPHIVQLSSLPDYWCKHPVPPEVQVIGAVIFKAGNAAIQVPSVLVPHEFNYILNASHPDMTKVRISSVEDFEFDCRL